MKVLLDTNIILDFALERIPHSEKAEKLLHLAFKKDFLKLIDSGQP
jgi:predicted nucleic acid-binding protein